MLTCLLVVSLVAFVNASNWLVIPISFGTSHEFIAYKIALEAVCRGHNVTIVLRNVTLQLDRFSKPPPALLRVIPLPLLVYTEERLMEIADSLGLVSPMQSMRQLMDILREEQPAQLRAVQHLIDDDHMDVGKSFCWLIESNSTDNDVVCLDSFQR
jgi:hypothetical protein